MKSTILSILAITLVSSLSAQDYQTRRPSEEERLFTSQVVEYKLHEVASQLTNPKLAWMFTNCFPNTLDTTVHFDKDGNDGRGDTFVYTGDIAAMWLRDSGAQVWPYLPYTVADDENTILFTLCFCITSQRISVPVMLL